MNGFAFRIVCALCLAAHLVLTTAASANSSVEFHAVTLKTARIAVPRSYDTVMKSIRASLSNLNIARAYKLYDTGISREKYIAAVRKAATKGKRRPYIVYEIRWELPIFVDTGKRKSKVHRFGLGIGGAKSGRKLVGKYPAAGLWLPVDVNVFADGDNRTIVDIVLPSGKYAASFAKEPGMEEFSKAADKQWLDFFKAVLGVN